MKKLLLALLLSFTCFFANAQCDYLNGDFEDWTTFPLDLGAGPSDVMLPDNHVSSTRFLIQLIEIFLLYNPDPLQLLADDPQLFMGIDRSTDASKGEYAVQLQGDSILNLADIWSVNACDEIQDSFKIDIRHVGTSSDTIFIYGAYDENVGPFPESQEALDTLAAYFIYQFVFDTITEYTTFTFPVFINDPSAPVDTFSFLVLTTFGDPDSYFLIDNIRFSDPVDGDGDGYAIDVDCDDNNASVNPGATETCNGIDDNCDGEVDEGLLAIFYLDSDGDGYGDAATSVQECDAPTNYVSNNEDCDDNNANVNPGAAEICDGLDNDCNGMTDDGLTFQDYYVDSDGDGYGDGAAINACQSPGMGYAIVTGDCNDNNASINPGATEICDGLDNDCDGDIDDNVVNQDYYLDMDGDGYGTGTAVNDCQSPGAGYVLLSGDCDDNNMAINPGAAEICDGLDNNCSGQIDEGVLVTFYLDSDNDGYGDAAMSLQDCSAPNNYVANADDCDDTNAAINPGAAEICDGIDNNCNGTVDDGLTFQDYYVDGDGDGYGTGAAISDCQSPGANFVLQGGDCDDTNANVNPSATEACNGLDDNCDSQVDEGVTTTYYLDGDGDGYGAETATVQDCSLPNGYADNGDDCDDSNPNVNPGATEIPANGIDDDCDGVDDPSNTDELAELGIRIFPNPVSDVVWLENVPPVGYTVALVNLIGQTVGTSSDNARIECQHLPSGAYFLKITEIKTMRRKVSLVVKE